MEVYQIDTKDVAKEPCPLKQNASRISAPRSHKIKRDTYAMVGSRYCILSCPYNKHRGCMEWHRAYQRVECNG